MEQKFERVMQRDDDGNLVPERYLYRRKYRNDDGRLVTRYYAVFTAGGKQRREPLGQELGRARNKLGELLRKRDADFDFEKAKAERKARGMTFSKWVAQCQKSRQNSDGEQGQDTDGEQKSGEQDQDGNQKASKKKKFRLTEDDARRIELHLEPYFGSMLLASIDDDAVEGYRERRETETVIRHKKNSKKLVTQTTINKEVATLRKLLRAARKKGYADKVTAFEMAPEKSRKRILKADEYVKLLSKCPAWLRRPCVMAWETALSRSDLLALTWDEIDLKEGLIELKDNRAKTDAEQAIPIITPELKALLSELQAERRRLAVERRTLADLNGLVFPMPNGAPIDELKFEYWFRKARKDAGIKNFTFHDFRHCAITRWAAAGVPTAAAMTAAGHKSVASHKKYQNLQKSHLKAGFLNSNLLTGYEQERSGETEEAVSG